MERNPEAVNYVAVGLASPTDDEKVFNVVPRDNEWESTSPTQRILNESDRNDSSSTSIVSSIFTSADDASSSAWDSIDEDEEAVEEICHDCHSHPSSPTQSSDRHPYPATPRYEPGWTDEIPLELIEATLEEETYNLRVEQRELEKATRRSPISIPDIPVALPLPRFLDRAILNRPVGGRGHRKDGAPSPPISPGSHISRICGRATDQEVGSYSSVERTSAYMAGAASVIASPILHEEIQDDKPFLTVPTHAVLDHLCTTAIKYGVVGMASTSRYKNKVSFIPLSRTFSLSDRPPCSS